MSKSDFLINNLICPILLGTCKGQLGGSCWRSLTIIFRRQLDQKIMRVCISYTHLYPIKSLNHTSPSIKYKLCFWTNMQVASTLWPDRKSQKISERRFRLKWTKCSPKTNPNAVKTRQTPAFKQKETQDSLPEEDGGGWPYWQADRPTRSAELGRRPHLLNFAMCHLLTGYSIRLCRFSPVAPCYKHKGGRE